MEPNRPDVVVGVNYERSNARRRNEDSVFLFSFRVCWMLLLFGNVPGAAGSELNLDCTNDLYEMMFCQIEAHNCSEYDVTLRSNEGYGEERCILESCVAGCCCSVKIVLVIHESHTATAWKGNKSMESKIISINKTAKPTKPTIISVNETNGNFAVIWRTTSTRPSLIKELQASVMYRKKGDSKENTFKLIKPSTVDGLQYFEIPGKHLDSWTTYVVQVKSYLKLSDRFSDSSEEFHFTTPVSHKFVISIVLISLSLAAIILSTAIYFCYDTLKTKWWDLATDYKNSKLLLMHSSEQEVLKPVPPVISSICVEPFNPDDSKPWSKGSLQSSSSSHQQSSGISTGSSSLSYANTEPVDILLGVQEAVCKALANANLSLPVAAALLPEPDAPYNTCELSSKTSGIDNITYSIHLPSPACRTEPAFSDIRPQTPIFCDPEYHHSVGCETPRPDQQLPLCLLPVQQDVIFPLVGSGSIHTDMSYLCNADSGRFSCAEDSGSSSISSSTNAAVENFEALGVGGAEGPVCAASASHALPPVDDDYLAFQTLVKQPDALLSEQSRGEEEEEEERFPKESITEAPQSFLNPMFPDFTKDVQGGRCVSELQRPFLSLLSAGQASSVITDSSYQCV